MTHLSANYTFRDKSNYLSLFYININYNYTIVICVIKNKTILSMIVLSYWLPHKIID